MPKRKASAWPASILGDPDVLSLDDEGRFVLCKICHVHYAVHGGKKPKPVIMNSNFRTRAWDVHKLRTNSHRVQREHERAVRNQQERARAVAEQHKQQQQQQTQNLQNQQQEQVPEVATSVSASTTASATTTSSSSEEMKRRNAASDSAARGFGGETKIDMSQVDRLDQWQQGQRQHEAELQETSFLRGRQQSGEDAQPRVGNRVRSLTLPGLSSDGLVARMREQQGGASPPSSGRSGEEKAAAAAAVVATLRHPFQLPLAVLSDRSQSTGSSTLQLGEQFEQRRAQLSDITSAQMEGMARWQHMHDDVSRALRTEPAKRRKSDEQPDARAGNNNSHSSGGSGGVNNTGDGRGKLAETYTKRELRVATTLAGTEEMTGNNRERVAQKLKSLNDQYQARNLRAEDTTAFLDPASNGYKTFWGTFRDVYSSKNMSSAKKESAVDGRTDRSTHHHYHHHHYYPNQQAKPRQQHAAAGEASFANRAIELKNEDSKGSEEPPLRSFDESDSTTPGNASNSSDGAAGKNPRQQNQKQHLLVGPDHQRQQNWPVTHDQPLERAFDRLTGVVSNELTGIFAHEAETRQLALSDLTMAVTELGTQQRDTANRYIDVQERNLDTMERILHHKLRRERATLHDEQSEETKGEET